jgi:hypothetical protein
LVEFETGYWMQLIFIRGIASLELVQGSNQGSIVLEKDSNDFKEM